MQTSIGELIASLPYLEGRMGNRVIGVQVWSEGGQEIEELRGLVSPSGSFALVGSDVKVAEGDDLTVATNQIHSGGQAFSHFGTRRLNIPVADS